MIIEFSLANLFNFLLPLSWFAALLTVPSVLIQRAGQPSAALSWLLALFALPAIAVILWWLIGRTHLRRKSRRRDSASKRVRASLETVQKEQGSSELQNQRYTNLHSQSDARATLIPSLPTDPIEQVFPATHGNKVHLLSDTMQTHAVWFRLIEQAQHHLHLLFYIWRADDIGYALRDALCEKAEQGVKVRVLYDAVGSYKLPTNFFNPLLEKGASVAKFMPIRLLTFTPTINFRNHRKLLIADGMQAYTGSINVGDEYLNWQEVGITIKGPGVNQLQEVFVDDWYFATNETITSDCYFPIFSSQNRDSDNHAICQTIASSPHQTFNTTRDMVIMAINQCQQRVWVATPYFIPGEPLMLALRTAVYRGVDVRLFVPSQSDSWLTHSASRVFYQDLLIGGVRIFEYQSMLHAKALLLDDESVLLGSANLDLRSFKLNFEISTFVHQPKINHDLATMLADVQRQSTEITLENIDNTSTFTRLQNAVAHLLSPLL